MKILIRTIKLFITLIFISTVSSSMLWAIDLPHNLIIDKKILQGNSNEELPHNLGIHGYSSVSYFEKNKAEMGLSHFSTEYKGKIYWFSSKDQIKTFNKNPEQYIPTFEAFCPYALALGRKIGIDPTNFKIVAGQLLLFHRTDEIDSLKAFNASANQDEILRRARENYLSLDF